MAHYSVLSLALCKAYDNVDKAACNTSNELDNDTALDDLMKFPS